MFIFLSLPSGNEEPRSDIERETLATFQSQASQASQMLNSSEYYSGYGNITGYQLSYDDYLNHKSVADWPVHKFSKDDPWIEDQRYSILPNEVIDMVKHFWGKDRVERNNGKAYMLNISGSAHGEFVPVESHVQPVKQKIPKYLKKYYNERTSNEDMGLEGATTEQEAKKEEKDETPKIGNITSPGLISVGIRAFQYNFNEPKFHVSNKSDHVSDAVVVRIDLNLKDYQEVNDYTIEMDAVYYQNTGALVATSNSAKFYGSYGLSHLTMNEDNFSIAKKLVSQYNSMQEDKTLSLDDMNASILKAFDQCEMVAFMQFNKTNFTHDELRYIDAELKNPSGKPLPETLPQLSVKDFVIYSPNCGIVLTNKSQTPFSGEKVEVWYKQVRHILTGLLVLVSLQLYLIFNQVNAARTPGQLSVISSKTLYFFGFEDSLLAIMSLLLSTIASDLYLLLACVATIAFISCGVFEMRFLVNVLTTQANERGTTWWEIMRGSRQEPSPNATPTAQPVEEPAEGPLLPVANPPAQQQQDQAQEQQATTEPNTAWQETSYSNSIFASGFTLSIIAMFLIFSAFEWRRRYRIIFEYVCLVFINSYWVPQFLRNTLKNRRNSFTWQFIIGSSIIRVVPIYYFALYKANPFKHRYDPYLCLLVTIWVLLQLGALVLQHRFGARFWINEKWLPQAYDYHRILSLKDLEEGRISSDLLASFKQKTSSQTTLESNTEGGAEEFVDCECTCPICMTEVTLPILVKDDDLSDSKKKNLQHHSGAAQKEYMITPCHHIFHADCLESWMKYKLQCPVCRTSLPPI
ncbi:hypothetical protein CANMA_002282 [Candida margitis]|uniref:uncharacterized protein n=1 Tax=Candida margitis TaxID=1775924 RepID=UPI002226370A|nr:uncharacterized protein CANMA_002282 [Candida margitis]KAI5968537.1 hypothetical protein CANMA_002282 [Candida margitis]